MMRSSFVTAPAEESRMGQLAVWWCLLFWERGGELEAGWEGGKEGSLSPSRSDQRRAAGPRLRPEGGDHSSSPSSALGVHHQYIFKRGYEGVLMAPASRISLRRRAWKSGFSAIMHINRVRELAIMSWPARTMPLQERVLKTCTWAENNLRASDKPQADTGNGNLVGHFIMFVCYSVGFDCKEWERRTWTKDMNWTEEIHWVEERYLSHPRPFSQVQWLRLPQGWVSCRLTNPHRRGV